MHQADNESDVDVYSPTGSHLTITDFIPQLRKLDHGPGTRVIFAEQEPGRRYSHDLNNFEELIAAYLRLDVAYSILAWLSKYVEEQETEFDAKVRQKEKEISEQLTSRVKATHERLKAITSEPPWDDPLPPSEAETKGKLQSFLLNVFSMLNQSPEFGSDTSFEDLQNLCASKIKELETSSKDRLEDAKNVLEDKIKLVSEKRNELRETLDTTKTLEQILSKSRSDLELLLGGRLESSLMEEKDRLTRESGSLIHRSNMLRESALTITSNDENCPLCGTNVGANNLAEHLKSKNSEIQEKTAATQLRIEELDRTLDSVAKLKDAIGQDLASLGVNSQKRAILEAEIGPVLGIATVSIESIEKKLIEFTSSLNDINANLLSEESKLQNFRDRLAKLRRTGDYHKAIRHLAKIDKFRNSGDYMDAMKKIAEFDALMNSMKKIRVSLEDAYVKAFSSYLPILSREMTKVYRHLTAQKSFDTIRIIAEPGNPVNNTRPKMILQVGSPHRNVWVTPDKADVLNGQALSALNLVPYFAFAKMGMSKHEIDFLLIDDPSQSFDMTHVEQLLTLLRSVADNSQVIVATHEKDRMEGKLRSLFEDYNAIDVIGFDVDSGPKYVNTLPLIMARQ
jgi:hypothetical protein